MDFATGDVNMLSAGRQPGTFLVLTIIFIVAEFIYAKLSANDHAVDVKEAAASVGVAVGGLLVRILTGGLATLPFLWLYQHRLFDIPTTGLWPILGLFLGVEFCYYWFHRASHRIRWFWATHSVHHSPTSLNLSAGIRLGWTGQLTGAFVFFMPLAWLGFHPVAIGAMLAAGLLYQFFLHAYADLSLGPLEWVLNTPRHHRVHHASNDGCLDMNYGSTLIIFDRLFGTFAPAPDEPLRYGLRGRAASNNPLRIAFSEWGHLGRDFAQARGFRARLKVLFGAP